MNNNLKIGQKVVVVPSEHCRSHERTPYEATIETISRKYFTLNNNSRSKFSIITLKEVDANSNYLAQCYLSIQDLLNKRKEIELEKEIAAIFKNQNSGLSLEKLEEIMKIINE